LNGWRLVVKLEDNESAFCRFLIALDELRARLSPSKYPNLEISDEGYLWFNVDSSSGTVEIFAFPFGFKEFKEPAIAISLPQKAEVVNFNFLNKLQQMADNIDGVKVFGCFSTREETLNAYKQNRHPSLNCLWELNEMLEMKKKISFFNYLGVIFSVIEKRIAEVEHIIKSVLSKLEEG